MGTFPYYKQQDQKDYHTYIRKVVGDNTGLRVLQIVHQLIDIAAAITYGIHIIFPIGLGGSVFRSVIAPNKAPCLKAGFLHRA